MFTLGRPGRRRECTDLRYNLDIVQIRRNPRGSGRTGPRSRYSALSAQLSKTRAAPCIDPSDNSSQLPLSHKSIHETRSSSIICNVGESPRNSAAQITTGEGRVLPVFTCSHPMGLLQYTSQDSLYPRNASEPQRDGI